MAGFFDEEDEAPQSNTARVEEVRLRPRVPTPPQEEFPHPGRKPGAGFFSDAPEPLRRPGGQADLQMPAVMPDDEGGFFGGNRSQTEDPFSMPSSGEEPAEDPVMAGIEAAGNGRSASQQQRDKTYDVIGKVAGAVGVVSGVADLVYPGSGSVVRGVGKAIGGAAVVGRGLGAVMDDAYDRIDSNRHEQTQADIARMKDQAARDKINKNTPRGHNKITED
ncbi:MULTISPECIES: hypothetical protein [Corallococcus]|uniref:hypothetical protein n=1 Tax=Corallococcus TaxID=83461 RepID=UPI000EE2FC58|nr:MULTISPECIES: hypothetical protein [Corallococcus]NPD22272.1 hypothetical protein [Corallococcus exiguus]RKI04610.1 hypothetical protein D7Y04_06735 [Corallococcus sp. AB038B]